jgi:hypothetical protein
MLLKAHLNISGWVNNIPQREHLELNQGPIELQSIALPLSYTPIHAFALQMVGQEMQSCPDG